MNTSIESIYILIKKHCINNYNKSYENIFTVEYINELFTKYNNNSDSQKLAYCLKTLNNIGIDYIININDIDNIKSLDNIKSKTIINRNDDTFKREVKARFNKCIICDDDNTNCCLECCEVAHIWDFAKCDNENDKYNSYNGLLMCANMHKLFDKDLIKLNYKDDKDDKDDNDNNALSVFISIDTSMINYPIYKYNNKKIILCKQNLQYLIKRYEVK